MDSKPDYQLGSAAHVCGIAEQWYSQFSQMLLNLESTDASIIITDAGSGNINFKSVPTGPRPSVANWHGWSWVGPVGSVNLAGNAGGYGDYPVQANDSAGVGVAPTATEPGYYKTTSIALKNTTTGVYSSGGSNASNVSLTLGNLRYFETRVKAFESTNVRFWLGALDYTVVSPLGANVLATDTPPDSFFGFRYSTAAGDTYWQCVANNAGTQTVLATTVALDLAASHLFAMQYSGGNILYFIDGVQVGSVSSNLPSTSLGFRTINSVDNPTANVARNMATAYVYWESNI